MQVNKNFVHAIMEYNSRSMNQSIYLFTGAMPTSSDIENNAVSEGAGYYGDVPNWAQNNGRDLVAHIDYSLRPGVFSEGDEHTIELSLMNDKATVHMPDTAPTWFLYIFGRGDARQVIVGSVGDENSDADMKIKSGVISADTMAFKFNDIKLTAVRS